MRIINLELNELPHEILYDFINKNKNSTFSRLLKSGQAEIYTTTAKDIKPKKLFPAQTWASMQTGKSYNEHKCYWFSDPLDEKDLIWTKLANSGISTGILGSIHSSKYPQDLFYNEKYNFLIPDCFTDKISTKPKKYENFQNLNAQLVASSARNTNVFSLANNILRHFKNLIINPKNYGISLYSLKYIFKIIFIAIFNRNKEILRLGQFPLSSSIFLDLYKKYTPEYATLFTNDLAGMMHRYWYAYRTDQFKIKDKYSSSWKKRNKNIIYLAMKMYDNFLFQLINNNLFKDTTIIITSSMGQKASPTFDEKNLAPYDGKIVDMDLFLKKFNQFLIGNNKDEISLTYYRNMAPQYAFTINDRSKYDELQLVEYFKYFLNKLKLASKFDIIDKYITMTIDPYNDHELQRSNNLKDVNSIYEEYGFIFEQISDHRSGTHIPEGVFLVINGTKRLHSIINNYCYSSKTINYLDFQKIILNYFK